MSQPEEIENLRLRNLMAGLIDEDSQLSASDCQELHRGIYELLQLRGKQLDALLAHCNQNECEECSKIICPHKDEMHFHHDGCPSCCNPKRPPQN